MPCGPNLERADDADFLDYYYDAEGRLPERYFVPGMRSDREQFSEDRVFDPASVDIKAERKAIEGFLRQSRDLRLLSLLARFEILAGRLTGFADALGAMAVLLQHFPEAAHPDLEAGTSERRTAVEYLTTPATVIFPLHYLGLNGQREVSFRRWQVASGKAQARQGEEDATTSSLLDALREAVSARTVEQTHADLGRCAQALTAIGRQLKAHPRKPITLSLEPVLEAVLDLHRLIAMARPDLAVWTDTASTTAPAAAADELAVPDARLTEPVARAAPVGQGEASVEIQSLIEAKVALRAVEVYLCLNEPSSAALLLATQARLLIGKPLVEALETLLPADAPKAVIDFGPGTGFSLSMERLRALSGELGDIRTPVQGLPDPPAPRITQRAEVASYMRAIENWYRRHEPTSPIPILLVRARSYLDKDFEAIVAELLPAKPIQAR